MRQAAAPLAMFAVSLAACTVPSTLPLSVDPRVAVRPDAGVAVPAPPDVTRAPGGLTRVTIAMRNLRPQNIAVDCTVDWFDADAHPIGGLSAIPTRIAVPASGTQFCELASPSPAAAQFHVAITPVY